MRENENQFGFTSSQFLLIIVIAAVVVGVIFAPRFLGQSGKTLHAQASEKIETLGIALDTYAKDNGDYPSTDQGLKALWEKPEIAPTPINWTGTYLKSPIEKDPWGNEYIYIRPGVHSRYSYDLVSFGKDGVEGGTGESEDIVSWIRADE